jgi:hypothetical protein
MATTTLNAGELELQVADLPEHVQRMVGLYDAAQEKKFVAETDFIVASAACRQLLLDVTKAVQAHLASTAEVEDEVEESAEEESAE